MLPHDFSIAHALAIATIFVCWFAYSIVLRRFAGGSLNFQLAVVRNHWLMAATGRDAKPFDAVLLGHITNSIAFFGSATLIVMAGVITAFARVNSVHKTVSELPFIAEISLELFAAQIGLVAFVLALCFFSFTYALRKLIYVITLVGALPSASDQHPGQRDMVDAAAVVLSEAVRTFNFGIRGYYYFVASLCLFISPVACIAATVIVTIVLVYRQIATGTAHAIRKYVEALNQPDR